MKRKINNLSEDNFTFQEEVDEGELYSKRTQSDIIYVDKRKSRIKILLALAIILILISIISAFIGFVYLDKDLKQIDNNTVVTKYNLFVSHSNRFYGGNINSFSVYDSLKNAYSYKFTVSNSNPVSLNYSVEFVNPNYGKDGIDMSLINYRLLKNDKVVNEGNLINSATEKMYETDIMQNISDEYVIQLWSFDLDRNLDFSFKINIGV